MKYTVYLLWNVKLFAKDEVDAELLDWCAEKHPAVALEYAAKLLTPVRLDLCAKLHPIIALKCAARFITPDRLDWCAKWHPRTAIKCASRLLTLERKKYCRDIVKNRRNV
jgi:hypothetical protein